MRSVFISLLLLVVDIGSLSAIAQAADDLVIDDFERETYAPWTATGEAFGPGPAKGTLPNQMQVEGYHGERLINSFTRGDATTGALLSPEFQIQRRYISFLIGGGQDAERLSLQLLIDGKPVRRSTGPNDQPGGSEALAPDHWDVAEFQGRTARLRILDEATGGWGHINVDFIRQTDTRPRGFLKDAERQIETQARYLLIPIKNGAAKRVVTLLVDGKPVVRNDIELADGEPDWWAPLEVAGWKGRKLILRVDRLHESSNALSQVTTSNTIPETDPLYQEPLRGQLHFSPRRGWNNDPNGMVYYKGEYHLFFQHNPYGWGWGNMHWGHAVSRDLVHWEELGEALLPDDMGPMFSGSAVVDWNNTSGLGTAQQPPLVLLYTAAGNPTVQGLAYSTDGRNFTKYQGNPVIPQITGGNRDPKVIWHGPTKQWVMVLYVEKPAGRHTVHFFTSPNLREWKVASVSEGDPVGRPFLFECPDLFELPIEGDTNNRRWVLLGANSEYAIGKFDGTTFVPDQTRLPGHRGRGFYAPQTFSDIPAQDGRRIQIGWFQTETRGMPFNQSMTIPLELKLASTPEGPRMTFTPVKELAALRQKSHTFEPLTLSPGDRNPLDDIRAELVEVRAEIEPGDATEIVFNLRDAMLVYSPAKQELFVEGQRAPAPLRDGRLKLTAYVDRTGLEVFASDGLAYFPIPRNANPENRRLFLETRGGAARVVSLQVHELKSIWPAR